MSDLSFSFLGVEGAGVLSALHHQVFKTPWSETEMVKLLDASGTQGVLASLHNSPIGLALIRTIAGESELLTIGIVPGHRKSGYGEALLSACERQCHQLNSSRLILEVSEINQAAIRLYQKCGYREIGQRKQYYRDGATARVLSKRL